MRKSVELEELFFGNFAECPRHPHRDIKTKDGITELSVCDFCKAVSYQGCPECEGECEIIACKKCKKDFCPNCGSGSTCKKCLSISSSSKNSKPNYYSEPSGTDIDYTIDEYSAEEVDDDEPEWTPLGDEETGPVKVTYNFDDPDIKITMDYDSSDPGDTDYDIDYDY